MLNQNGSPNYGPRDWLMASVGRGVAGKREEEEEEKKSQLGSEHRFSEGFVCLCAERGWRAAEGEQER